MTRLANVLRHQKRFEEALELADKAIAIDPKRHLAYYNKAQCHHQLGQLDEAEEAYRQQVELASQAGAHAAYNNLGLVLKDQGKLADAAEMFRKAVRQMPEGHVPHRNLIVTLQQMARKGELTPESLRELGQLNSQLLRTQRDSVKDYRQKLSLNPRDTETRLSLVMTLKKLGNLTGAFTEAQRAVALDRENVQARYELARVHVDLKQFDEGIAQLRRAIKLDENKWISHAMLGRTLAEKATGKKTSSGFSSVPFPELKVELDEQQAAMVDEAIKSLERAYALAAKIEDSRLSSGNLVMMLEQLFELRGRKEEAESWGQKRDQLATLLQEKRAGRPPTAPRNGGIRQILSQTVSLQREGKLDEALKGVSEYLKSNPDVPELLLLQAKLFRELSQESKAIENYHRLVAKFPNYFGGYRELGKHHRLEGNLGEAEKLLRQGLDTVADRKMFLYRELAHVYFLQGKHSEAVEQFDLALRESPHDSFLAVSGSASSLNTSVSLTMRSSKPEPRRQASAAFLRICWLCCSSWTSTRPATIPA